MQSESIDKYDPRRFLMQDNKTPSDFKEFQCGVCFEFCRSPANLICCDTSPICVACLNRHYQTSSKCPCCRNDHSVVVAGRTSLVACLNAWRQAAIDKFMVRCPWFESGCPMEYSLGRLDSGDVYHLQHCKYAQWKCQDCDTVKETTSLAISLHEHQQSEECKVNCTHCQLQLPGRNKRDHESACGCKPVHMDCCNIDIQASQYNAHLQANEWHCPNLVKCPNDCGKYNYQEQAWKATLLAPDTVNTHVTDACPYTRIPCTLLCNSLVLRHSMLAHHSYNCPKGPAKCAKCDTRMLREQLKSHQDNPGKCANYVRCTNLCMLTDYPKDVAEAAVAAANKRRKSQAWHWTYTDKYSRYVLQSKLQQHLDSECAKRLALAAAPASVALPAAPASSLQLAPAVAPESLLSLKDSVESFEESVRSLQEMVRQLSKKKSRKRPRSPAAALAPTALPAAPESL